MWSGCRQADAVVSQAYPGYAEICPGFPPPQAARVTVASGEKGLWVVWYNSDVVKVGKSALAGFKYVLGLSLYWWWALILSLRSGAGPYSWVKTRCVYEGRISNTEYRMAISSKNISSNCIDSWLLHSYFPCLYMFI